MIQAYSTDFRNRVAGAAERHELPGRWSSIWRSPEHGGKTGTDCIDEHRALRRWQLEQTVAGSWPKRLAVNVRPAVFWPDISKSY
jgi:hypothetical protein